MNWKTIDFDWNHAKAFLVTAKEGSFSAAARALDLTQPTLGRQVSALEQALGVALFERVGKQLQLTEDGIELLSHIEPMGEAASRVSLAATGRSQSLQGNVAIAASEIDALYRLPPIIAQLRQLEPGIEIEVVVSNEVSDLQRREADIAIRSFRPRQPGLIAKKVRDLPVWFYATGQYLDTVPGQDGDKKVRQVDFIGFDRSSLVIDRLSEHGWQLSPENFPVISKFHPLHVELARQHVGLTFLPEDIGDRQPELVRAFPQFGPPLSLSMWLVCHQELRTSLRVQRVFQFLAQTL
ncbi:LysR family transcriptional regulator [Photobacterium atrarenae]|uniref:LysR family transcriptional regulator n=1 Tax=Photobacterium atrarenae TaxID=865757 RepID=A0ABY5GDF2_9GAMM|nr:LysR family transcriptional regulator [Photobacterium atrarenae]UTV27225.1 LysR family transcriptional regulator [Photobacterium atrarenae]